MKKTLAIVLAAVLAASLLAACGTAPAASSTAAPAASSTPASSAPAQAGSQSTDVPSMSDPVHAAAMGYFENFPEDKHMISVADLFKKIDAAEDMLILDVRQAEDYTAGHLKGAVNVPYGPAVADMLEMIPDDVPLFVNCYSGQTSSQVVALLNIAGKFATNIQGGYKGGIAAEAGFEKYIDTTAVTLTAEDYVVDDAVEEAIAKYFADATASEFKSFNFPPEKLLELVNAGSEDYTILSIRKAEDFAKGHIAGAMNIPFAKGMQAEFGNVAMGKPVVVYCYSGQTSSQTVAVMRMLGYEAYSLQGGMGKEGGAGWLGVSGPVVTE